MKRLRRVQTTFTGYVLWQCAVLEDLQKLNWLPITKRRSDYLQLKFQYYQCLWLKISWSTKVGYSNWKRHRTQQWNYLRANVCNFRESVDSREFLNFFIFCSNNLYSTLISKITLKLVTAFYFFRNQAKFEKLSIGALSSMKLAKIEHFLRART